MRSTRVFTSLPPVPGRELRLEGSAAKHLLKVLRLSSGEGFTLFDGDGREYAARLLRGGKDRAYVAVESLLREEPAPALELALVLGISKGERMDFAIQKAVELGITRIRPVFAARSVVQLAGERLERRLAHWRGVLVAACEQSGRCRLPLLEPPRPLPQALGSAGADRRLVLFHRAETTLSELAPPQRGVELLVGPEGGLQERELAAAGEAGFVPVRLGPRILRTETAPLAALAAIQVLWGDFRGP